MVRASFLVICISIHAPAGGATLFFIKKANLSTISIHAPAGGATAHISRAICEYRISIHAPAGGATIRCDFPVLESLFQFTPLREGRRSHIAGDM